jgi:hypothetical protein
MRSLKLAALALIVRPCLPHNNRRRASINTANTGAGQCGGRAGACLRAA